MPEALSIDPLNNRLITGKIVRGNLSHPEVERVCLSEYKDEPDLSSVINKLRKSGFQVDSSNTFNIIKVLFGELQKTQQSFEEIKEKHRKLTLSQKKIRGSLTASKAELAKVKAERNNFKKLCNIDDKTGILNYKGIHDSLREEIKRVSRRDISTDEKNFYVAMLDLDNFGKLNKDYGHVAADKVLENIAQTVKNTARQSDIVGRFGGEEFVVIFTDPKTDIAIATERIRKVINTTFDCLCDGEELSILPSASIGVSCLQIPDKITETIISSIIESAFVRADKNLNEAKEAGKNRVVIEQKQL